MLFRVELVTEQNEKFTFTNVQIVDTDARSVYIYEQGGTNPKFFKWGDIKQMKQELQDAYNSRYNQ